MEEQDDEFDLMLDGVVSIDMLQEWLQAILYDLNDDKKKALYLQIQSCGPTSKDDLRFLETKHIRSVLTELRATRFLDDLKKMLCGKDQRVGHQRLMPQISDFKFDKKLMTPDVLKICTSKTAPSEQDVRTVVKLLGPFCRDTRPAKEHMTTYVNAVTLNFVKEYSILLDTTEDGKILNDGNKSLYKQVYAWVDNHSRPDKSSDNAPKRRKRATNILTLKINAPPVINFELASAAKEQLKEAFMKDPKDWDVIRMRLLLSESYALQRSEINRYIQDPAEATKKILEEWPVLFHPIGAASHFTAGCEKNPNATLDDFLNRQIHLLKYFLIHKCGAPVVKQEIAGQAARALVQGRDSRAVLIITILQMLATFFKEDINQLIVMVEDNVEIVGEGERMNEVPLTPSLVGQGINAASCTAYYLMVEGIRVFGPCTALQGIRVIFPAHFMLSIAYNDKLKNTCEFYQRIIMGYNDTDAPVGSAVLKAMKTFAKFKSELE